jgi:UPF0755 protein
MPVKRLFILLIFVVTVAMTLDLWSVATERPVNPADTERVMVTIPTGSSASDVAILLSDAGVIRSSLAFQVRVRVAGLASSIRAGTFVLYRSLDLSTIISTVTQEGTGEVAVTIPEGFTVADIDALIAKLELADSGAILDCATRCDFETFEFLPSTAPRAGKGGRLEGYLFPDTYFVAPAEFVPKFFIERLLGTFRKRVITDLSADIASANRSLADIVTMASLVEEETRTDEERPIVAGILWKRLDAGMGLGVDATVRYVLGKRSGALTSQDLAVDSLYNLRKYAGLPPGPIANPGLSSIRAALRPQSSTHWYYLHDGQGQIHYADTNDAHNANKAKYLY